MVQTASTTVASRHISPWLRPLATGMAGLALLAHIGVAQCQEGQGLTGNNTSTTMWPHWEGRIGLVLDHSISSSPRQAFALTLPSTLGLKVHGAQLLSDYYFSGGGFRATAGLVRGAANLPWWPSGGKSTSGLNLSLDGLDLATPPVSGTGNVDESDKTAAYVGAGYSTRLSQAQNYGAWHFNADLGLISLNSANIGRFTRMLQGDQGIEDLVRELRLRPMLKVRVDYAF